MYGAWKAAYWQGENTHRTRAATTCQSNCNGPGHKQRRAIITALTCVEMSLVSRLLFNHVWLQVYTHTHAASIQPLLPIELSVTYVNSLHQRCKSLHFHRDKGNISDSVSTEAWRPETGEWVSFPQLLSALPETSEQTFTVSFVPWAPHGPVMHTYGAKPELGS